MCQSDVQSQHRPKLSVSCRVPRNLYSSLYHSHADILVREVVRSGRLASPWVIIFRSPGFLRTLGEVDVEPDYKQMRPCECHRNRASPSIRFYKSDGPFPATAKWTTDGNSRMLFLCCYELLPRVWFVGQQTIKVPYTAQPRKAP